MKLRFLAFGFILLPGLALAQYGTGGPYRLYERVREGVEWEIQTEKSEPNVREYVARVLTAQGTPLSASDVETALKEEQWNFCSGRTFADCPQIYSSIHELAARTARIRSIGRELLLIASGMEVGVDGHLGRPFELHARLPGITRIWQSSSDLLFTPLAGQIPLRAISESDTTIRREDVSALRGALEGVRYAGDNALEGVVWRYRNGIASFLPDRGVETCTGSMVLSNLELRDFSAKRWCAVEDALTTLRSALPALPEDFDPPLKPGESALYATEEFPDLHVIVWFKVENHLGEIERDAGLQFDLPVDPVLPALLKEGAKKSCMDEVGDEEYCRVVDEVGVIPGGRYPLALSDPREREGICSQALARRGYLCRRVEAQSCGEPLPKEPREIVLAECAPERFSAPVSMTNRGHDVCKIGWWQTPIDDADLARDTPDEDPDLTVDSCSNCVVDMYCGRCDEGMYAVTYPKNDDGVIKICISEETPPALLPYVIVHELTHAQQYCPTLLGTGHDELFGSREKCCAREREAYLVSGNAFAQDGLLDEIGISLEEFASGAANASCRDYGECSPVDIDPDALIRAALARIEDRRGDAPTCRDLIANLKREEPRAWSMKQSLRNPCSPGCRTKYVNSIGNHLCYLSECTEQSVEEFRLIGGRMTGTVQDESFPWDSCERDDPRNAAVITLPASAPPPIPVYRLPELIASLDSALCAASGMPPRTPPVLCGFDPSRRLQIPSRDFHVNALSLLSQQEESWTPAAALQLQTSGIAVREGIDLTLEYFSYAGRALTDVVRTAASLVRQIGEAPLPRVMCPRFGADEPLCFQMSIP